MAILSDRLKTVDLPDYGEILFTGLTREFAILTESRYKSFRAMVNPFPLKRKKINLVKRL
jgi:hypothetical protein